MTSVAQTIGRLRALFPRQPFPDDSVREYARELADFPPDELDRAVSALARRSEWLPSVSEIVREIAEQRLQLPSPSEAWRLVVDCAVGMVGLPRGTHPAVRLAQDTIGDPWTIRMSENPGMLRAQFLKAYESERERAIREVAEARPELAAGNGHLEIQP